ncbi:MAG: hypothetical protein QNJ78_04795 [Gammaproteobacteria bacterium]|nr:hypothetical protein [Gammaproteobacteria bacterium]
MSWLFWRRPHINFYQPNADAVSLVVEGEKRPWPMRKDHRGNWTARLRLPYRDLHGRAYHFKVNVNGNSYQIADPLASRTERREKKLISLFSDLTYKHKYNKFRAPPFSEIVIYETHLPALTRHASAKVEDEKYRGTYRGACSPDILKHLQRLKVAVEFLPLHAHSKTLGQDWGYFSTSFRALRNDLAFDKHHVNREVMMLVDTYHGRGIPVLLDVVFNHGGELLVKAWGENVVYRKFENGDFCEGSGCGPTIQTENPLIRETILETLEHLVEQYRFDGFRFDLGALHDKKIMLEIDRRLPDRIYLVAEPWALGGTKWDKGDMHRDFATTRWAIWNDDFREPGKTFIRGLGDQHNRDRLMRAIVGSHIKDGGWAVRPQQSINYLSSHDGKTLADLVDGDKRRVFLGIILVMTSQGIPMLSEGSEIMYSKQGHHNSYDRPDLNQIDWTQATKHQDLLEAVARLITLRKQLPHFGYTRHLKANDHKSDRWDIDWIYPTGYPHDDDVNAIGFVLKPPVKDLFGYREKRHNLVTLLNGSKKGVNFHLPKGEWKVLVDGHSFDVNAFGLSSVPNAKQHYHTHPGTGVILAHV